VAPHEAIFKEFKRLIKMAPDYRERLQKIHKTIDQVQRKKTMIDHKMPPSQLSSSELSPPPRAFRLKKRILKIEGEQGVPENVSRQ
jgi:hypothetical protein